MLISLIYELFHMSERLHQISLNYFYTFQILFVLTNLIDIYCAWTDTEPYLLTARQKFLRNLNALLIGQTIHGVADELGYLILISGGYFVCKVMLGVFQVE